MLTVWGRTNSLNVQKVLWTLAEINLEYRRVEAGMQFGVNDTPQYRVMNPNALVPTIDDDGLVLWESNVIVRYLATNYAMGTLCPDKIEERFLAEQWMDWQQTTLNPALGPIFSQLIRTPPAKRDATIVENNRQSVERWMGVLDAHLAGRDFVNGAWLTMADIPVGAAVNRWYALPVARASRPHVEGWLARLKERPGFKAHVDLPLS